MPSFTVSRSDGARLLLASSVLMFLQPAEAAVEFCWKDSYGRGVGTIPDQCPEKDKVGLLCYDKCPDGYTRVGLDCHSVCPDGWRDDGLFCRMAEYGRGSGYAWWWGDSFNLDAAYDRCKADHASCEKWGQMYYPSCAPGYYAAGCCICRPSDVNCEEHGLGGRVDLSCAKKVIVGNPTLTSCAANLEEDAGLCYTQCRDGFNGHGPVCWAHTPTGMVGCGMGAAESSAKCAEVVGNQIMSVVEVGLTIASLGSSAAATHSLKTAQSSNKLLRAFRSAKSQVKHIYNTNQKFKKAVDTAESTGETSEQLYGVYGILTEEEPQSPEDLVRLTASIVSLFDPTGVSSVISAYTYGKCSAVSG